MTRHSSFNTEVGMRLKLARTANGRSLSRLAAEAGIGKGTLSEIESGQRNPTLATLYSLANALGTPLSELLPDQPGARISSPGITAQLLDTAQQAGGTVVEVFLLTLTPGQGHISAAHAAGTVEHLYLTEGRAAVGPVENPTTLSTGESATWAADTTHSYQGLDTPARGVLTITTPDR